MAVKNSKSRKQTNSAENKTTAQNNRAAQILFAIFAVILILSMVLSAVTSF